jgi:hypothetical protein
MMTRSTRSSRHTNPRDGTFHASVPRRPPTLRGDPAMNLRPALAALVVLAVGVRLAVMLPGVGRTMDDPDNYLPLARALAEGRGLWLQGRLTAYRPPLYPLLLAPLVSLLGDRPDGGIRVLHLALGAGTVALTARAARGWGLPPGQVLVASAIVALDPVLVVQGRGVMTETFAAFLVAATLAAISSVRGPGWRGAACGGLGFGLAALCRPSLLPGAVLATLAALGAGPGRWRDRLSRACALALATTATLAPWAWRNARIFGEPVWTTTHGGYTLALANNPTYYAEVLDGPSGAVWSGPNQARWQEQISREVTGMTEPQADRRLRRAGLRMLEVRPGAFARASLARLGRLWGVAPAAAVYPPALRAATTLWTVPLWVLLGAGLLRRTSWHWPRVVAPMVLIALTAVHSIFWTDLRMRAPAVPAIALLAASAASHPPLRRAR